MAKKNKRYGKAKANAAAKGKNANKRKVRYAKGTACSDDSG